MEKVQKREMRSTLQVAQNDVRESLSKHPEPYSVFSHILAPVISKSYHICSLMNSNVY